METPSQHKYVVKKHTKLTFGTPRSPYPIPGGTKRVRVSPLKENNDHFTFRENSIERIFFVNSFQTCTFQGPPSHIPAVTIIINIIGSIAVMIIMIVMKMSTTMIYYMFI